MLYRPVIYVPMIVAVVTVSCFTSLDSSGANKCLVSFGGIREIENVRIPTNGTQRMNSRVCAGLMSRRSTLAPAPMVAVGSLYEVGGRSFANTVLRQQDSRVGRHDMTHVRNM